MQCHSYAIHKISIKSRSYHTDVTIQFEAHICAVSPGHFKSKAKMKSTLAITLVAVLISCAYSADLDMDFPNCHRSDSFNNAIKECAQQMFGVETSNMETTPQPEHHDLDKKVVFETCVSQKLGFDCHGTITTDDVNDIMATVVTSNEEIRAALTVDVTNCITENQNEGQKVMICMMESLKKNCS